QWVSRIVCPTSGSAVYATVAGSQTKPGTHVFRLPPGNGPWISMQGNLPNVSVSSLVVDTRTQTPVLYVATDRGVYVSSNLGVGWEQYGSSLPNVVVSDLVLDTRLNILLAATFGRGWWEIPVGTIGTSVTLSSSQNPSTAGQTVTFTATVSCAVPPTGTVSFF